MTEHSLPYRHYFTPLGNLLLDESCFSNYGLYLIPGGAVKAEVKFQLKDSTY